MIWKVKVKNKPVRVPSRNPSTELLLVQTIKALEEENNQLRNQKNHSMKQD